MTDANNRDVDVNVDDDNDTGVPPLDDAAQCVPAYF